MSISRIDKPPRIAVGLDGSASSVAALHWAIHLARLTGGTVDAVVASLVPVSVTGAGSVLVALSDCSDIEQIAKRALEEVINKIIGPGDGPLVRSLAVHGSPGPVLVNASVGAELLVLGSRGHGGFSGAVLGSVGQHCVRHAHCPVVIIRGDLAVKAA